MTNYKKFFQLYKKKLKDTETYKDFTGHGICEVKFSVSCNLSYPTLGSQQVESHNLIELDFEDLEYLSNKYKQRLHAEQQSEVNRINKEYSEIEDI